MLQNKLQTLYFEPKLNYTWLRCVGYLRVVARSWFQPLLWDVLGLAVSREAYDLVNEHAPSGLCMWPFYCGQVMDRCAYSGSSCLNTFKTCLWPICGKKKILDNLPAKRCGQKQKSVFENIPHLRIINLWDLFYWGSFDF